MTVLQRLRARNFRNLSDLDLFPGPGVNWIVGDNAAGKTALLESIYCLTRRRSFRGRRFGSVVSSGASEALVEAWIEGEHLSRSVRWAVGTGANVRRVDDEYREGLFSCRLICESTHSLVEGEPALRRRFFDWNLCLLEAEFIALFKRFARVSAQRNAWLRCGGSGRPVWDAPYCSLLSAILVRRARLFDELAEAFRGLTQNEEWFDEVELRRSGPDHLSESLLERLREMLPSDRERGYTYLGPSRWDFSFMRDGKLWVGSRGEGKVLATLVQVAAEIVVSRSRGGASIWLVDDIDAELSPEWSARLLDLLTRRAIQMFVTSLPGKLEMVRGQSGAHSVFHVERGVLRCAVCP